MIAKVSNSQDPDRRRHAVAVEAEAARDSTRSVQAAAARPAIAMKPQTRKDRGHAHGDDDGLGEERPKPRTRDPHEIPRTEIFAANHGMNSRSFPCGLGFWNDVRSKATDSQRAR